MRLLVLGHYPLDVLDRAPKVRTFHMAQAFSEIGDTVLISGDRMYRRRALSRALARDLLSRIDAVYLESGSSTATETDLWFLSRVRKKGVPLGIFIRDVYQRFPGLYPVKTAKHWLMKQAYEISLKAYDRSASTLFFPTQGLANLVAPQSPVVLLPPGAQQLTRPRLVARGENQIIYVGANGRWDGIEMLCDAFVRVRETIPEAKLIIVTRPEAGNPYRWVEGVEWISASGEELSQYLWRSSVAVIPRIDTAYHRMAFPVKLMDYLGHRLPVVVTGPSDAARFVEEHGGGVATTADVSGLVEAICKVLASQAQQHHFQEQINTVLQHHLWRHRAEKVVSTLLS